MDGAWGGVGPHPIPEALQGGNSKGVACGADPVATAVSHMKVSAPSGPALSPLDSQEGSGLGGGSIAPAHSAPWDVPLRGRT